MPDELIHVTASAKEVAEIIEAILPSIEGHDPPAIMLAALTIAVLMQAPGITPEQLLPIVDSVSQHMALLLSNEGGSN